MEDPEPTCPVCGGRLTRVRKLSGLLPRELVRTMVERKVLYEYPERAERVKAALRAGERVPPEDLAWIHAYEEALRRGEEEKLAEREVKRVVEVVLPKGMTVYYCSKCGLYFVPKTVRGKVQLVTVTPTDVLRELAKMWRELGELLPPELLEALPPGLPPAARRALPAAAWGPTWLTEEEVEEARMELESGLPFSEVARRLREKARRRPPRERPPFWPYGE